VAFKEKRETKKKQTQHTTTLSSLFLGLLERPETNEWMNEKSHNLTDSTWWD